MPPEVIAAQVMTGDNGASLAAAAAAYQALVATLTTEGATMAATTAGTAASGWEGLGGTAMMATAMPYVAALETLSAWVEQAGAAAAAILEAYTTTRTSLIPVPACETNRAEWKAAVDTNWFGFRFPEIIALDGEYFGHFWTQNASLAGTYEAIVTGILAALATPPPPAPLTANPAGAAAQAAAIGEAAANGAMNASMHAGMQGVNEAASGTQAGAAPCRSGTVDAVERTADARAAESIAADGRPAAADARAVPADAQPVPADGDGHARPAGQRDERQQRRRPRGTRQGQRRCGARRGGGGYRGSRR